MTRAHARQCASAEPLYTEQRLEVAHRVEANTAVHYVFALGIIYRHLQIIYLEKLTNVPNAHKLVIKKLFFMYLYLDLAKQRSLRMTV